MTWVRLIPNMAIALRPRATYHRLPCRAVEIAHGGNVTEVTEGMVIDTRDEAFCVYCYGSSAEAAILAKGEVK